MRAEAAVWTIMVPAVVVDPHRKETKTGVSPPFEQTAEFVLIGSAASGSGGSALAELHGGARPRARRRARTSTPNSTARAPPLMAEDHSRPGRVVAANRRFAAAAAQGVHRGPSMSPRLA